jgi:NAD(P)-dependent dehydrogenase (short-subunit alcohol dehydrogenase family)
VSKILHPLRGVITCAGISGESPAVDYPIDAFRRIIDINLNRTFICVQAAAREIVKHQHLASFALIASMSAHNYNKVR